MKSTLLAIGAVALWSTNAIVARYALGGLDVEQVQLLQFVGASLVFLLARIFPGQAGGGPDAAGLTLGLVGITGTMIFQYLAFAAGPIAQVNIVAYAWPLIAALMILMRSKADRPFRFAGLTAMGFLGAALVILQNGNGLQATTFGVGHFWAMGSALCMAVYSAGIGHVKCNQNTVHLAGSVAGLAIAGLWCAIAGRPFPDPQTSSFWLALYLGAGPIGMGYLLWAQAMRWSPSGRTASLGYLTPVGSTLLLALSGAVLGPLAMVGSVIVILCCAATGIEIQHHARA